MVFLLSLINMEAQEQRLDQASLTELFLKIKLDLQAYLIFLKRRKLVRFCSKDKFLDHAFKVGRKTNCLPPHFRQQFQNEQKNTLTGKYKQFLYPLITSNRPEFEVKTIFQFATEFYQKSITQQLVKKGQVKKLKKSKRKAFSDDQKNKKQVVVSINVKNQPSFIKEFSQQQGVQSPSPIKNHPQCEDFFDDPLSHMQPQIKADEILENEELPQNINKYFCTYNENAKYIGSLLALNVSNQFRKEFQEVKIMIKNQLLSGQRPKRIYLEFLKDYIMFSKISQGFFEKTMQQQLVVPRLKEKGPEQIQILKDVWKKLKQNIESHPEKESNINPIDILLQGIDNAYLTFHLSAKLYGVTVLGGILININQADKHIKSLDQYRNGPLKSYIALTLYHQLGHYLLRRHSQINLNQVNGSFQYNQDNIGNTFLQVIKKRMEQKPEWIKINNYQQFLASEEFNIQETIEDLQKMVTQIKLQYERQCQILSENQSQVNELIKNIQKLSIPYLTKDFNKNLRTISEIQWEEIFTYIDSLNPDLSSNEELWTSERQIQYQFFLSLLLFENVLANCYSQDDPKCQKIIKYQEKLKMLSKFEHFHYYQKPIGGIDNFIEKILNDKLNMNKMQQFAKYYLIEGNNICHFIKQAEEIEKYFNVSSLRKLYVGITMLFDQAGTFFTIQKGKHQKIKQTCKRLKRIVPNLKNLQQIINSLYAYTCFIQFQQFFEIFKIVLELPSFYQASHENCQQKIFQSGYDIQKRLFGRNNIKDIYAKDFQLMKNINYKWSEIGIEPPDQQEKLMKIAIERSGKTTSQLSISVNRIGCGVYQNNQARIQLKKDLIELNKLRDASQHLQDIQEKEEVDLLPPS